MERFFSNGLVISGPTKAVQPPEGVQSVAQVRSAIHANVPAMPGDLSVDGKDRNSIVAN